MTPEAPTVMLAPGDIHYRQGLGKMLTVLGSGVALCLWHSEYKWGAMCHFNYPRTADKTVATPAYGNVAGLYLKRLLAQQALEASTLQAHLYGGSHPDDAAGETIGEQNVAMAETIISKLDLTVNSRDTGGTMGRKVIFDVQSGHVASLKVHNIRKDDWAPEVWS